MNELLDLELSSLELVAQILSEQLPHAQIFFFGSRTTGRAKPFSDIDILIDAGNPLTLEQITLLNTKFDESLLPYKVDIADACSINKEFKSAIENQLVPLNALSF